MFGKQIVDIETDGNESDESGKKVSIKVMGKSVIDGYTDFIQEDSEESDNEDS
jgi:prophage tail gpP-like protein